MVPFSIFDPHYLSLFSISSMPFKSIYVCVCMYCYLSINVMKLCMSHLFMWDTQEILCYLFRVYYFYYCSSEIEKSKHFIYNKRTHNINCKLRSFFFFLSSLFSSTSFIQTEHIFSLLMNHTIKQSHIWKEALGSREAFQIYYFCILPIYLSISLPKIYILDRQCICMTKTLIKCI